MSTESDRDRSVERLLGQALRAGAGPEASGACLDAETLAAWVDRGLAENDLSTAEAHLSECSRCQALVATLERTRPADSERKPWWRPTFGFGWWVPLTATAAAILVWVILPGREPARSPGAPGAQMQAAATPEAQEPSLALRRQAPAAVREELRAPAASLQAAKGDTASAAPPEERDARKDAGKPEQERSSRDSLGRLSAPPAAPAASAAAAASAAPAASGAPTQVDERAAAAPAETFAARSLALPARARAGAIAIEIASPDPSFRWRIGSAGVVEHSTDGGSTWEVLPTGVVAGLTAGMSPSPSVCWLVGRSGSVLLSTDGRHWQRVAFPEATDLVAVQASDAQAATVTTADGRTFRTTDGGVKWDRRPLQEF